MSSCAKSAMNRKPRFSGSLIIEWLHVDFFLYLALVTPEIVELTKVCASLWYFHTYYQMLVVSEFESAWAVYNLSFCVDLVKV